MKKIMFLISDQHLISHGGIGSFCKSFCKMQKSFGNEVHIVVDKKPTDNFVYTFVDNFGLTKLGYNDKPLSYSKHQQIFMYGESVNYEKIINFQKIILSLLEDNSYDYIVVNSQEAFAAISTINTKSKVILYTHLYKQILLEQGSNNVLVLPMPISETDLLVKSDIEKSGVLFIGRWEKGKNPEAYIKIMKQLKLPCKVMTNKNGEKKFIKAFTENGITDYIIKSEITGKEKIDFIKSCKVSFNCSLIENYPFSFIECVGHMPVVVLDQQNWSNNFDEKYYHKTNISKAVNLINDLYNKPYNDDALSYVNQLHTNSISSWKNL